MLAVIVWKRWACPTSTVNNEPLSLHVTTLNKVEFLIYQIIFLAQDSSYTPI